jgi:hypothetical protein
MAKTIKAKNVAPTVAVEAKPIDKAIALKAAQDAAVAVFSEHSAAFDALEGIGKRLTDCIITIHNLTMPGRDRELGMRPLIDAVCAKRNTDEKGAKKYLSTYVSNARKAVELRDAGVAVETTTIKAVKDAAKKKGAATGEPKSRGGRTPKADLEKVMDYARPLLAGLKEAQSKTGGYSQAVELLLWTAQEMKYEAVYNSQHKTLVVTIK